MDELSSLTVPSTWEKANQHWVSICLLKGFGIKNNASEVFCLDVETGSINKRSVEHIASKQRLITEADHKLMSAIESSAAATLKRLRKGNLHLLRRMRRALDDLVLMLIQLNPHDGIGLDEMRAYAIERTKSLIVESFASKGLAVPPEASSDLLNWYLNHDHLNLFFTNTRSTSRAVIRRMGLTLFTAADGEYFVIGDSPVLMFRGSTLDGSRSLLARDSNIVLPLGSHKLAVYSWLTPSNEVIDGGVLEAPAIQQIAQR